MANSQTILDVPVRSGVAPFIRQHEIVIDTINTDFTLRTPFTGTRIFIVGVSQLSSNAADITWKRGSTTINPMNFAANSGLAISPGNGFQLATGTNEALIMRSSAVISLIVFTVEAAGWNLI